MKFVLDKGYILLEMILNMHNEGISIETISKCANLTIQEVEDIINQNKN